MATMWKKKVLMEIVMMEKIMIAMGKLIQQTLIVINHQLLPFLAMHLNVPGEAEIQIA
jgi:hypothetical protein